MVVSDFEYILVEVHVRWYIQGRVGYIGHASELEAKAALPTHTLSAGALAVM